MIARASFQNWYKQGFEAKRPSLVRSHPAPAWHRLLLLLRRHRDSLRPWTLDTACDSPHCICIGIALHSSEVQTLMSESCFASALSQYRETIVVGLFAGGQVRLQGKSVDSLNNLSLFDLGQDVHVFTTTPNQTAFQIKSSMILSSRQRFLYVLLVDAPSAATAVTVQPEQYDTHESPSGSRACPFFQWR